MADAEEMVRTAEDRAKAAAQSMVDDARRDADLRVGKVQEEAQNSLNQMQAQYAEKERKHLETVARSQRSIEDLRRQLDDASESWKEAVNRANALERENEKLQGEIQDLQGKSDNKSFGSKLFGGFW